MYVTEDPLLLPLASTDSTKSAEADVAGRCGVAEYMDGDGRQNQDDRKDDQRLKKEKPLCLFSIHSVC